MENQTTSKAEYKVNNMKKAQQTRMKKITEEKEEKEYQRLLELHAKRQQQQEQQEQQVQQVQQVPVQQVQQQSKYILEDNDSESSVEEYTYVPMKKIKKEKTPVAKKTTRAKPVKNIEQDNNTNEELEQLRKYKAEMEAKARQPVEVPKPTQKEQVIDNLRHKILNF